MTERGSREWQFMTACVSARKCSESLELHHLFGANWLLAGRLQLDPGTSTSQLPSTIAEAREWFSQSQVEIVLLETSRRGSARDGIFPRTWIPCGNAQDQRLKEH